MSQSLWWVGIEQLNFSIIDYLRWKIRFICHMSIYIYIIQLPLCEYVHDVWNPNKAVWMRAVPSKRINLWYNALFKLIVDTKKCHKSDYRHISNKLCTVRAMLQVNRQPLYRHVSSAGVWSGFWTPSGVNINKDNNNRGCTIYIRYMCRKLNDIWIDSSREPEST